MLLSLEVSQDLVSSTFRFYPGLIMLSSIVILLFGFANYSSAFGYSDQITSNEQLTDNQGSVFSQAEQGAQYNTFRDSTHNFSFTPPTGWTQGGVTGNQTAFFTKDSGGTIGTLAIDYETGRHLPDSIFSLPDQTILDVVANNMLNSTQPIVGKSMQKYSDGMKFKVIYASQVSQEVATKSEQILFWLKDGRQYYFTLVCDDYNFNKNAADFENSVNTLYVTSPNQQASSQTQIPGWIKNNAKWWSEGSVTDDDFIKGIQYLMQNGIMRIPPGNSPSNSSHQIPVWVKHNAGWWASGQISDDDFVKGIQYLVTNGIIKT